MGSKPHPHPSVPTFRLHVSFALKWVFCDQCIVGFCVLLCLIQSATLCLRLAALSPLASQVVVGSCAFTAALNLALPLILCFSVPVVFSSVLLTLFSLVFSSFWFL